MLNQLRLKELLHYNPDTGIFTNLVKRGHARVGAAAGSICGTGYRYISIGHFNHCAHRLAWLYVSGEYPSNDIDHINGIRNDNRIVNLRSVTRAENIQNQLRPQSGNKSGFLGVHWNKKDKKWQAQIDVKRANIYLGQFATPELASDAYKEAKKRLHISQVISP